uniref:N-acetyltransferase domain-containing protein n=1 Tax=Parascaris equorum TaxID=6256 RepID=A0A914SKF9_PAREQ
MAVFYLVFLDRIMHRKLSPGAQISLKSSLQNRGIKGIFIWERVSLKVPAWELRNSSIVIGLLKIGYKCLYLVDTTMKTFKTTPLCVLDFYVHDTLQRMGNGHSLFECMLQVGSPLFANIYLNKHEGSPVERIAIDKPSDSLLQFMNKYYALTDPLWQSTNYVVYSPFFHYLQPCDALNSARKQPFSSKTDALHTEKEKTQRARIQDSVAEIMYGGSSSPIRVIAAPDTPQGRKNARDF